MLNSLFRRNKRKPVGSVPADDGISSAEVSDVFTVSGFDVELDSGYYLVESKHRYKTVYAEWFEIIGAEGDKKLWVYWSQDAGQLFVSVTADNTPLSSNALGLSHEDLVKLDEEHSIDNYFTYNGTEYYYTNSGEAFYFQENAGEGSGYYTWDFISSDETMVLSVDKFEGRPFEGYISEIVRPDSITVYKQ